MAVMEVLLMLGLWMGPAGLLVQASNVNQQVGTRYYRESMHVRSPRPADACSSNPTYGELLQLTQVSSCLPAVMVWEKLHQQSRHCKDKIISILSDHFGHVVNNPSYCHFDQNLTLPNYTIYADFSVHNNCMHNDSEYKNLYNTYVANSENRGFGVCTTHHQVWQHLRNVQHTENLQLCMEELVFYLSDAYEHHSGYNCATDAYEHNSGYNWASVPIAVTAVPAVTTTTPLASVLAVTSCKRYATITSLAHGIQFNHTLAASCGSTNDHLSSEALVFNLCQTNNDTSQWKEGPNVMSNCQNIPLYTLVATFINGVYSSNGGLSGIFLGCLPDGFKIAVQECGSNSTIINLVHGGIFTHDPKLYFLVIQ